MKMPVEQNQGQRAGLCVAAQAVGGGGGLLDPLLCQTFLGSASMFLLVG